MNKIDYSVYLVTDRDILKGRDLCRAVEESILGGVTPVSYTHLRAHETVY